MNLIRLVMMLLHAHLSEQHLESLIALEVHDELIFEYPRDEVDRMKELARREMENVFLLDVPLKVNFGVGANWSAAH